MADRPVKRAIELIGSDDLVPSEARIKCPVCMATNPSVVGHNYPDGLDGVLFGNNTTGDPTPVPGLQGLPVPLRIVWQADEDEAADAKLEEIGKTISLRDNIYGWVYRMPRADRDRREWLWIPASVWGELLSPNRDPAPNEASLRRQVESMIRSHGITTRQLRARLPFIEARDTGNRSFPIPDGSILDNPERK